LNVTKKMDLVHAEIHENEGGGHPESYKVWSMELRETYKENENGTSRQLQYIENGDGT
jgi:hypothetical protein